MSKARRRVVMVLSGWAALATLGSSPHDLASPEVDENTCTVCHSGIPGADDPGARSPQTTTLACLSCHDGVIAQDVMSLAPGTFGHPVSQSYPPLEQLDYRSRGEVSAFGLALFGPGGDQMECATCHRPHGQDPSLLRRSNAGSALCLACHLK